MNLKLNKEILHIALPITLQSIFQASFSLFDQLMVGQLGAVSIAGSGLGGKFSSFYSVTVTAIATVASIMISQYRGSQDEKSINKSFFVNLYLAFIVALIFIIPSLLIPDKIIGVYSSDAKTGIAGAQYLSIIAPSFLCMAVTFMISTLLRSLEYSKYPMYASVVSMFLNIIGNYILIYGKFGFSAMGLQGAAIATLLSRVFEMVMLIICIIQVKRREKLYMDYHITVEKIFLIKIFKIVLPILLTEFLWSLGENIYAVIYGRLGVEALAAMMLTNSLQGLFVGAFSGISAAAVVMVGNRLGKGDFDESYIISQKLVKIGLKGSVIFGILLSFLAKYYVRLFDVNADIRRMTCYILYAFSFFLFAKVTNMILGGGVLRSGGKTQIVCIIDFIGTWCFGIPVALLGAFVFKLPIYWVYFILSMEELVRLAISIVVFRKRIWMQNITNHLAA